MAESSATALYPFQLFNLCNHHFFYTVSSHHAYQIKRLCLHYMLLWAIRVLDLEYNGWYKWVVCQIPCVTTQTWITSCVSVEQGIKINNLDFYLSLSLSVPFTLLPSFFSFIYTLIFSSHTHYFHPSFRSKATAGTLFSGSVTFSWSWQGACEAWSTRLSLGFSHCCYSVAYSKNNTLLLTQSPDLYITP